MTPKEFNVILQDTLDKCSNLLSNKSKEYDFSSDRLHSFKSAAQLQNTNQVKSLLGYLTKHIISVYDMSEKYEDFSLDKWDEKIIDCINYFILLRAILKEESRYEKASKSNLQKPVKQKESLKERLACNGIILKEPDGDINEGY